MKQVLKKDQVIKYKSLSAQNLPDLPYLITNAAMAGHWLHLDNLHTVKQYIPEIQKFLYQMFNYQRDQEVKK